MNNNIHSMIVRQRPLTEQICGRTYVEECRFESLAVYVMHERGRDIPRWKKGPKPRFVGGIRPSFCA